MWIFVIFIKMNIYLKDTYLTFERNQFSSLFVLVISIASETLPFVILASVKQMVFFVVLCVNTSFLAAA